MAYQVIARKWRPQKFDDVVGQQAVTRTLRNALASGRLAQAFVFAGPRGVGKTTTARILARALNCVHGPTPDPCGTCDACVEIAEGRDMDVLEIDAATHTQVDNVREVIIAGLAIAPVRNRFKVFIIDEVHQLSNASFNALLKSIEEPPPHVVFMMATTELDKIPETVLSRAQAYEFRAIGSKVIADQLRTIVDEEKIAVPDEALQLIARDADGSMRDAQTKLDQVIAFTGNTITVDDVGTVLGLVGRDLLLDAVDAVANEDAPAAFRLSARAVELGYDLRAVCRELSRVVRDLLVVSVDPSRVDDPEIAGEGERDRVKALAGRFSREDLLRAFDLLTKAEQDIRGAAQPRYHLEMALLRWIYVRKLVSIEDLIAGGGAPSTAGPRAAGPAVRTPAAAAPSIVGRPAPREPAKAATPATAAAAATAPASAAPAPPAGNAKDAFLAEIRKQKMVFYSTIVAQAQKIDVTGDRITFTFSANQRSLRDALEEKRSWLESVAQQATGRRFAVGSVHLTDTAGGAPSGAAPSDTADKADKKTALREQALADPGVQAMLEVFPADIRDVEEM
ncbi:MAG TPA: DNA polymerase III subunit gamma/tau [Vicinamibacterales bacterium]|nr:DNA polymerase III subunit gamma/tau [Vicinamibacterales bacterium]